LTIKSIPAAWGDVGLKQFRIDSTNNMGMVNSKLSKAAERTDGSITVDGKWARAAASTNDPKGAAQGLDLIVVTGSGAMQE
jgi:hypothetical protein